jgi:hypothetical protein
MTIVNYEALEVDGKTRRPLTPEEIDEWLENMHNYVYTLKSGVKVVKKGELS